MTGTPPQQRTVLHVGSGPRNPQTLHPIFHGSDWREVRLDVDRGVEPDILASITDMKPVETNSVDAVWCAHVLEHLYAHDVPLALAECSRVLMVGGFIMVAVPDLQAIAEWIAADRLAETAYMSPAGPITPLDMVYGFGTALASGRHFMAHRTGFTGRTLAMAMMQAGFPKVEIERQAFELRARAEKGPPL